MCSVGRDRLPIVGERAGAGLVDIDDAGVALGAVADDAVAKLAGEIDRERDAAGNICGLGRDQPPLAVEIGELGVGAGRCAAAEADLREQRAGADQHRKGLRADLGIEAAVIAFGDLVERRAGRGDHPGEDVEPAGRTFRVCRRGDTGRQRQPLLQRHHIDAARLQHRAAVRQADLVQPEGFQLVRDAEPRAGQEARPHAVRDAPKPQIEARRLHLRGPHSVIGSDSPAGDELADRLGGQQAGLAGGDRRRRVLNSSGRSVCLHPAHFSSSLS